MDTYSSTKQQLLYRLKKTGNLSMEDAMDETGLAKTTLREHLLQLERDAVIERRYHKSGPGRPSLRYQLTDKGQKLFPSGESKLLGELVAWLEERGEQKQMESFLRDYWNRRLNRVKEQMATDGKEKKESLALLYKLLEDEGFMPDIDVDREKKEITIRECNCPFRSLVRQTRLPCELEIEFYRELLGRPVERTEYIADGDSSCTYCIRL